jgi:hypothetical protein
VRSSSNSSKRKNQTNKEKETTTNHVFLSFLSCFFPLFFTKYYLLTPPHLLSPTNSQT